MNALVDYFWKPLVQNSWSTVENEIRKKCSSLLVSEKVWRYWTLKWACSVWQVVSLSVNSRPLAASMKIYSSCIKLKFWKTAVCAWILVAKFPRDSACTILTPAGKYAEILHVIAPPDFVGWAGFACWHLMWRKGGFFSVFKGWFLILLWSVDMHKSAFVPK